MTGRMLLSSAALAMVLLGGCAKYEPRVVGDLVTPAGAISAEVRSYPSDPPAKMVVRAIEMTSRGELLDRLGSLGGSGERGRPLTSKRLELVERPDGAGRNLFALRIEPIDFRDDFNVRLWIDYHGHRFRVLLPYRRKTTYVAGRGHIVAWTREGETVADLGRSDGGPLGVGLFVQGGV